AAEELAFTAGTVPAEAALLRVGLANGHGEISRVLHLGDGDPAAHALRADLAAALGRHATLTAGQRAAVLASLLQTLLEA
ncbi:MAG TPA: hypothetical protein VFT99_20085, partial [Roseiflexaceae bacterium]|nr:hypothetical protein [Roseiflexaceae bacterium]